MSDEVYETVKCEACAGTGRIKGGIKSKFAKDRRRRPRCSDCFGGGTVSIRKTVAAEGQK